MKTRILLITAIAFVGLAVAAPLVGAQAPANYYQAKPEWAHGEMTVPDTGRADMELLVPMEASGFVCVQPEGCKIAVELKLDPFAKWAGSSLEPFTATYNIPTGQPSTAVVIFQPSEDLKLNLAWDVETAPKTGAKQDYVVTTGAYRFEGAAVPQAQQRTGKSSVMTATLPDRPTETNATSGVDCQMDPFNPACATAGTSAPAESPFVDTTLLLSAVVAMGLLFRRRSA
jgi:hypothetical protein